MTTVIFVHGTGVRKEVYEATFEIISSQLGQHEGITVFPCYWGDLGSRLHQGGVSIPDYDTTRAVTEEGAVGVTDEEYNVALWGLLYEDSLYELRVLSLREKQKAELPPGQMPPGAELAQHGKQFPITPELQALLEKGGIEQEFEPARAAITSSEVYRAALTGAPAGLADHRAAVARALIAEASARSMRANRPSIVANDVELRDEIQQMLIQELGGEEYGIGGWLKQQLSGFVFALGSKYVQRRRGAITDAAYPFAGDILLYQARGGEIRELIQKCISQAAPPRVLLAHSLGGIACVDLLVEKPQNIELLVTVGSQAPLLYEINALQSLPFGHSLPEHFPRWLNIFDKRDILSYIGRELFPGKDVIDVEVDSRQPFPASHSAYWSNRAVWSTLLGELP